MLADVVGDHKPRWEAPLRLFGGVHYLELAGLVEDPWASFRDVLVGHRDWLAQFVAEQPVQTNEVQRCWGLLPGFLTVAGDVPVDLVELGPSGGLNLFWDRYRYRYGGLGWGSADAGLELSGEARGGPPASLLGSEVTVRRRVGVDRQPVDVTSEYGARVLEAFVWADQTHRLERLRRAIAVAQDDPPELLEGDFVEILPALLRRRDLDALTIVFDSVSTIYLRDDDAARLESVLAEEGERGSLARVSYEIERIGYEDFALDVQAWPGGVRRRLARLDGHGNSLGWLP